LLVEFLELYGFCFNSNSVGITLTNGGRYYQRVSANLHRNHPYAASLELLDPQDETNNVASGTFNYGGVIFAFKKAYKEITDAISRYYHRSPNSSFAEPLLGNMLYIPDSTVKMRQNLLSAYYVLFKATRW